MTITENCRKSIPGQKSRHDGFMSIQDQNYLRSYGIDQFVELINREKINVIKNHMEYGDDYEFLFGNSMMRAYVINKIFNLAATPELKMTDKGIIYQSISILDKYYH